MALVEDSDLLAGHQEDRVGPLVGPSDAEVVEPSGVAQCHLARVVDLVVVDAVTLDVDWARVRASGR